LNESEFEIAERLLDTACSVGPQAGRLATRGRSAVESGLMMDAFKEYLFVRRAEDPRLCAAPFTG
jgi:hypothetical protein